MSVNDFYVAIQELLAAAYEAGWSIVQIEDAVTDAVNEWLDVVDPINEEEDD